MLSNSVNLTWKVRREGWKQRGRKGDTEKRVKVRCVRCTSVGYITRRDAVVRLVLTRTPKSALNTILVSQNTRAQKFFFFEIFFFLSIDFLKRKYFFFQIFFRILIKATENFRSKYGRKEKFLLKKKKKENDFVARNVFSSR